MAHNLRTKMVNGEKYVSSIDLLKLIHEVMVLDSLHPAAVQALDGLGTGLAISLNLVSIEDLPDYLRKLKQGVDNAGVIEGEAESSPI